MCSSQAYVKRGKLKYLKNIEDQNMELKKLKNTTV